MIYKKNTVSSHNVIILKIKSSLKKSSLKIKLNVIVLKIKKYSKKIIAQNITIIVQIKLIR